jgi:protein-S-isoprenylcysteine O-methyltransferase Ste14
MEFFTRQLVELHGLDFIKGCAWAVSSAEVANIIATHVNLSQVPQYGARVVQLLRALHPTPITPVFLAGSLAVITGGFFRLYCSLTLGRQWSYPISIRKEHRLVTSGPYSIVRHPSYTGYLLQYAGIVAVYTSKGSWMRESGVLQVPVVKVVAGSCFFLLTALVGTAIDRPAIEDKMLQRVVGDEWMNWAKRVKYRLIPGIY